MKHGSIMVLVTLRQALRFEVWTLGLLLAFLMFASDRVGYPASVVLGAPLVLALGLGLGANFHRSARCRISKCLPRWRLTGVATMLLIMTAACLAGLALGLGRPGYGGAVVTAGAFGLAAGMLLGFRFLVLVLSLPFIARPIFGIDLHGLLLAPASQGVALGMLMVVLAHALRGNLHAFPSGRIWPGLFGRPGPDFDPTRFGRLHRLIPALGWVISGWALWLLLGVIGQARLGGPTWPLLAGYLWLFTLIGMWQLAGANTWAARGWLRRMHVLPGWSRGRIFAHAESSLVRSATWLLAGFLPAAVIAWWMGGLKSVTLLSAPLLWVACAAVVIFGSLLASAESRRIPHYLASSGVLVFAVFPSWILLSMIQHAERPLLLLPVLFAGLLSLAWFLRRAARDAWLETPLVRPPRELAEQG